MEELNYKVVNQSGKESGTITLKASVFDAPSVSSLLHETVRWQRNRARSGTHKALTKAEVSGGGKKPWRQKGTGNARAGSNTSPLWVGGGKSHGPSPRDYDFRLSKRARRQALAAVLSEKRRNGQLLIVDQFKLSKGKTSEMLKVLKNLGVAGKSTLLVLPSDQGKAEEQYLQRAARNIADLKLLEIGGLNVYDILKTQFLVSSSKEIELLQERLTKER